jgi:Tfp pilus assembly protein PilX
MNKDKTCFIQRGFTLLVAIIFMSVMLTFGLALGALGYKQKVLASSSLGSQYAFYVADAALECILNDDQQQDLFAYTSDMSAPAPTISCDGVDAISSSVNRHTLTDWVVSARFSMDAGKHCADVMILKPALRTDTTRLFAQGYDVPCDVVDSPSGARFASRGINAHY